MQNYFHLSFLWGMVHASKRDDLTCSGMNFLIVVHPVEMQQILFASLEGSLS
jgi:hypothetical protein